MTRPQLSFYNPFRTPLLTPNLTGASVTSSAPSYHTALPFSHTLLTPTPTGMSTVSRAPSYQTVAEADSHSDDEDVPEVLPELTPRMPSRQITSSPPQTPPSSPPPFDLPPDLTPDDIPESAPPAYSLTPNVGGGETIVEQGPRRPFQRAPEPTQPTQPPPPPPTERPPSQMSDFARDFYAAGTEPFPPVPPSPAAPLQQQRQYAPPPGPPPPAALVQQQTRYAPPPGAPPPTRRPSSASTSSGAGSTSSLARDGHPTTTPTPGRPLLRNGRTLIYPETYFCPKCEPHFRLFLSFRLARSLIHKAGTRATRTLTRCFHAASAGTASASRSRPYSHRVRGVTMAATLRARASTVAHSSDRFLRSSPRRRSPPHARRRPHCPACSSPLTHHHHALSRRSYPPVRFLRLGPRW